MLLQDGAQKINQPVSEVLSIRQSLPDLYGKFFLPMNIGLIQEVLVVIIVDFMFIFERKARTIY